MRRRSCAVAVIVGICACVGCNSPQASEPSNEARYQLTKDRDGRVLRLDTVTGEVTVAAPPPVTTQRAAPTTVRNGPAPAAPADVSGIVDAPAVNGAMPAGGPMPAPEPQPIVEVTPPATNPVSGTAGIDMCSRQEIPRQAVTLSDAP